LRLPQHSSGCHTLTVLPSNPKIKHLFECVAELVYWPIPEVPMTEALSMMPRLENPAAATPAPIRIATSRGVEVREVMALPGGW
jgi:hypothetical protein